MGAVTALQEQLSTLQTKIEGQDEQLQKLRKMFPLIQEQMESTSNRKLLNIVKEQEAAHQEFLDALRSGMYDLAHMLPGSRTWLEVYGEKVDLAAAHSKSRENDLKKLASKKATQNSDDDW